ncbi:hypothetical protein MKW94_008766 [Papaver nudicaule]|uniref:50S ribosomal protein 6, chloroplastic n=1 Tax=Papaver nudicaule TaxID=74823 RepID=A0AA41S4F4_PAPNU|nr:hypothetical protein [Papaver nudicaule]MCL7042717.1 hypothetical protein [Papaver nudicaule]
MSICSGIFGARLGAAAVLPKQQQQVSNYSTIGDVGVSNGVMMMPTGRVAMPMIECSSRPQKKGTAHHRKTRPKKSQPWDIKRGKTIYPPLPALPADWTLVSAAPATTDITDSVVVGESSVDNVE